LFAAALTAGTMQAARAADAPPPPEGPIYVVNYIDLTADAARGALATLRTYRDATRMAAGNTRAELLQEIGRDNRVALIEQWENFDTLQANRSGAAMTQLNAALQDITYAPPDLRAHTVFSAAPLKGSDFDAIWVLTHVDVGPPTLPQLEAMMPAFIEASRADVNAAQFDFVRQTDRRNHFTLIEGWTSRSAQIDHELAPATKAFRASVQPLMGALYDQRFYRVLD